MFFFNKTLRLLKWMVAAFLGSTIFSVVVLRFVPIYFTPLMLIRCVEQFSNGDEIVCKHKWVSLSDISHNLKIAVIASEDQKFYEHNGFDFDAIGHAWENNKQNQNRRLGGSTISQQTAKNIFLWPDRSWVRKGLEAYFTVLIELLWPKDRILEVYLNSIEMGKGLYGAEAVANSHFNCSASELSKGQCALIAASLPNPLKFNSQNPNKFMKSRKKRILREMRYVERQNNLQSRNRY